MDKLLISSSFVAFAFATWPVITRVAKIPSIWTAILINLGTVIIAFVVWKLKYATEFPSTTMVAIGLGAGLLNGAGFLVYSVLFTQYPVSTVITLIDIMIPIIALIIGWLFLKEPLTAQKIIGVIVACFGIYLITKT